MYKKIGLIIIIFLICGCSKKETKTDTVIEYGDNIKIAINYPITNIKKVDQKIKNYINLTYQEFKNEYSNKLENTSELNISYYYNELKNYISISLTTFISSNTLAHPINKVYTIVYDKSAKKIVKLGDILNEGEIKKEIPRIKQQLIEKYKECLIVEMLDAKINEDLNKYQLFLIEEDSIILFFNPYEITSGNCNIINAEIPFKTEKKEDKVENITPTYIEIDTTKPMVAFTFDDGPSKYTQKIIEILEKYEAVGTFFVIGNKLDIYKDTIKLMYQRGNEIGNHSFNHKWLTRLDNDELNIEINQTQNKVKEIIGIEPKLLRPTYGANNDYLRKNTNLKIIMWDIDTRDWELKNYKTIAKKALSKIKDGDIILMHDTRERTYKALEIMLSKLKEQGFQFVTVSQLKELKKDNN